MAEVALGYTISARGRVPLGHIDAPIWIFGTPGPYKNLYLLHTLRKVI